MSIKKYKRNSTNMTISIFYEQHCLNKFNYDPPYQRDYNVWDSKQKSFLIDSIFKNFPLPPIFLEQKIFNGKTNYDVIDGKQRLNTIVSFINNKVKLPHDFGNDIYGNSVINGKSFEEIKEIAKKNDEIQDYVDMFWSYSLNIEYIDKPDEKIVDNIFDRLNRGGERLNNAELRKAKYYDSIMYQGIMSLSKSPNVTKNLKHLDSTRLENLSFITEVYLLVLKNEIISGVEKEIDKYFDKYVDIIDKNKNNDIVTKVDEIFKTFSSFNIDLEKYRISGTSHLYALLYVVKKCIENKYNINKSFTDKLNHFYSDLRNHSTNNVVILYSESMQSASKYKSSRKKRVEALMNYLGI